VGWFEQIIAMAPPPPTPIGPPGADGGAGGNGQVRLVDDKMPITPKVGTDGGAGGSVPETQQRAPQPASSLPAPAQNNASKADFGQCVRQEVHDKIGWDMVKEGFKTGAEKAGKGVLIGGAGGAMLTPEAGGAGAVPGAIGGGVLGFIGGFGEGLLKAPIKATIEGAWDCSK
jgi:hypothetical protein